LAWGEDKAMAYVQRLRRQSVGNFGAGNPRNDATGEILERFMEENGIAKPDLMTPDHARDDLLV
jgi:hypothetical protein